MNWLQSFMRDRNGVDQLSNFMIILSIILLVLSRVFEIRILYFISLLNIIFAYYRVFSKNRNKRYKENMKYVNTVGMIKGRIKSFFNRLTGLKDYKYYKCSSCNQKIRVPRKKGKIKIICPKCKNEMIRRT